MPTKAENRNYKAEAAKEDPKRQQDRRDRMNARYAYEKKHGDLPTTTQVDHIKPLSQGGTNADSNVRAISKKRNESFNRAGPGGKQLHRAK
jgi:5-methylcytosine-specific restriction endonuclease McrA